MNGLQGRMLRMPPPTGKKREMLFVYGHHSSLERWWGVMQDLNQYGGLTMPDLPGFGGMQSLYKIGEKPNVDTLADYLAAFVKLHYKRRRVTIIGLSFGFVIATRMLQRYPDLVKRVDLVVSVVGFSHHDDFAFSRARYRFYVAGARLLSGRLTSGAYRLLFANPWFLRSAYHRSFNAKDKFKDKTGSEFEATMDMEIKLWHDNDMRTHMSTNVAMLTINNCGKTVDLPVYHVSMQSDRYFNEQHVEQHLRIIFNDVHHIKSKMDGHAPSVIADKKSSAKMIPRQLRKLLAH
jgi:pimeloyl-ACP methyl ester carboxylesterase